MATLSGDIMALNRLDPMLHAVGASIVVKHAGKVIATGTVDDDESFSIEIADEVQGELEISLAMHNAAPTLATTDGGDLHVTVLYSNVNNYLA